MQAANDYSGMLQDTELRLSGSQTVASQIYRTLRDRIISMQLLPGATMSEQETANALGVSRTPVREAFISLSREKMVIISPQRRTAVAKISIDRVKQERFLRESLEQAVLEQFLLNPSEEVLHQLDENVLLQQQAIAAKDFKLFLQHDDEFHKLFYVATENMLCHHILKRNFFDYQRLRYLSSCSAEEIQILNMNQHQKLLQLIREHNLMDAQALLRKHLRRLFDEIKVLSAQYPQYFM